MLANALAGRRGTDEFSALLDDIENLAVRVLAVNLDGTQTPMDALSVKVASENIDELFIHADRKIGQGVLKGLWRHLADGGVAVDLARLEAIALASDGAILQRVEDEAAAIADQWLQEHRLTINGLTEERRQPYDAIRNTARRAQLSALSMPLSIDVRVGESTERWDRHLYQDSDGKLPATLNTWEQAAADEFPSGENVRWLRNIERKPWALAVPYEKESGGVAPMYPDFLLLERTGHGVVVDIVDPHRIDLTDAAPKARGLARYAEDHGSEFRRIELIIVDRTGAPKRLNLTDPPTRKKVLGVANSTHLQQLYDGL